MCGRYVIARAQGDLLGGVELDESIADYNVAPTRTVPILVDHQENDSWTRRIHSARCPFTANQSPVDTRPVTAG